MGKVAFLFAGQGAQKIGMAKDLYESDNDVKEVLDRIESIRPGTLDMMWNGNLNDLSSTINSQPCIFAADYAAYIFAINNGIKPDAVCGFSLGEIPALVATEVSTLEDGFKLVVKRGLFMAEAASNNPGGMVAVMKLKSGEIDKILKNYENLYAVNYNSLYQTVVSGDEKELEDFIKEVKVKRGLGIRIKVSGAFHSPFMKEASIKMEEYLEKVSLSSPKIPLYSNVTAFPYNNKVKDLIVKQIVSPVLFKKTIENMIADGINTFVELGPGKVLSSLVKQIIKDNKNFYDNDSEFIVDNIENTENIERVVKNVKR